MPLTTTFDSSLSEQQKRWIVLALAQASYPWDLIDGAVNFAIDPSVPSHHAYMYTTPGDPQQVGIEPNADKRNRDNRGIAEADIPKYYREVLIHEMGHVVSNIRALDPAVVCPLFYYKAGAGEKHRQGTVDDWSNDETTLDKWEDSIQEAVAEVFHDTFLSDVNRTFENRTKWEIDEADFCTLMDLLLPPMSPGTPGDPGVPPSDNSGYDEVFLRNEILQGPTWPSGNIPYWSTSDHAWIVNHLGDPGHDVVDPVYAEEYARFPDVVPADPVAHYVGTLGPGYTLTDFHLRLRIVNPTALPRAFYLTGGGFDAAGDTDLSWLEEWPEAMYMLEADGVRIASYTPSDLLSTPTDSDGHYIELDYTALAGKLLRLVGVLETPTTASGIDALFNDITVSGAPPWWGHLKYSWTVHYAGIPGTPDVPGTPFPCPPYPYAKGVSARTGYTAAIMLERMRRQAARLEYLSMSR